MQRRSLRVARGLAAAIGVTAGLGAVTLAQRGGYDRLRCESTDRREEFCAASIDGDVRIVRQLGKASCIEGRTWRWDRSGIVVRDGCRAEFEYRRRSGNWGGGWERGLSGSSRYDRVTCQSMGRSEAFCPAPIAGDVYVARKLSDAPCTEGRTWNWNRDGVRVFDGCRAEFQYRRRRGELNPGASPRTRVTCQSRDEREQFCPAPIEGDVSVSRQISGTRCREGRNWNWSRDGVRVWEGCGAEFEYRPRK